MRTFSPKFGLIPLMTVGKPGSEKTTFKMTSRSKEKFEKKELRARKQNHAHICSRATDKMRFEETATQTKKQERTGRDARNRCVVP